MFAEVVYFDPMFHTAVVMAAVGIWVIAICLIIKQK